MHVMEGGLLKERNVGMSKECELSCEKWVHEIQNTRTKFYLDINLTIVTVMEFL